MCRRRSGSSQEEGKLKFSDTSRDGSAGLKFYTITAATAGNEELMINSIRARLMVERGPRYGVVKSCPWRVDIADKVVDYRRSPENFGAAPPTTGTRRRKKTHQPSALLLLLLLCNSCARYLIVTFIMITYKWEEGGQPR